jgi:predicted Zn-dependent peptidase
MTVLDRKTAPAIHDAIDFDYQLPPINKSSLKNGIPMYWLSAGVQDVVELDIVFPAGIWQEPKSAVALATAGLIKNGTSRQTAHEIHESIEFFGANIRVSAGDDFSIVSLYALTRDLPKLLPILRDILTDSIFPDDEVAIHKQNAIQRLLVNLRQCEFVANQRIDVLLYGEHHPYGRYSRVEFIEALTRGDLQQFYRESYTWDQAQIFMGGKISEAEAQLVDDIFGGLSATRGSKSEELHIPTPAKEMAPIRLINDPAGVQAAIRIARPMPNRQHPDFPALVVLNTLFGGYFGSRLMSNIREDKGYTYGIYSSLAPNLHGGSVCIHTEVGRDVLEPAVAEIYKEMELLCRVPADAEELLLVKNYLLGGLLGDLDGPFHILQRWRSLILNGQDENQFETNIRTYKSISAEELLALAQKYFQREAFYELAVI